MDIAPFELERWFAEYEHEADLMLAESGIRSLSTERFDLDVGELGYVIPTNGDPEFRAEVGARYDRPAEEVLFTCGAQEANYLAFHALLDEDDHAVVVTPTYQALHAVPEAIADVTRVELEPPEWDLDVDAVVDAMQENTEVVVLNNPNNPTGKYHPQGEVEDLYEACAERDTYLLCDEVYRLLAEEPIDPVASLGEYGISTSSVTKSFGLAGLRFGWLAGPEAVVDAAWGWKDYTTISAGKIDQHVAKQAIDDQQSIVPANREVVRQNHDLVADFLDEHGLDWHDPVGVNGFVTVPEGFEGSRDFCRQVVEEVSVVLAPGGCFGDAFDGYFRIGFGLPTEELADGLERLDDFLAEH
ncbi:aminotransferase class I/II-fold pyridoxal phosphate-dependent enzyme [Halospeciosus flavus]|uniref:Aminotransferase class I/II-fold pyridoxal phosphate-dependent enzyme n=1 Tax=Halospeciosus flavus TaxID=3032283 RepID=A0ABD5Z8K8_9EURY|nr:aminotransferase class I/II-fold pyridoxal phosphate-dependent enzyme [Halospeciosus flavus]